MVRAGKMFTGDVTVLRTDGEGRAEGKVRQMEVFGNPLHQKPRTAPVIEPLAEETMEHGPAGIKGLQPILMLESFEDIFCHADWKLG